MKELSFEDIVFLIYVTGGKLPMMRVTNLGQVVKPLNAGFGTTGKMSQIKMHPSGVIDVLNMEVSSILGCGHSISSFDEIAGICQLCLRVVCVKPGCLATCVIEGYTVCRSHYQIHRGFPVSARARKGLWRSKIKALEKQQRLLKDGAPKKSLPAKRKQ